MKVKELLTKLNNLPASLWDADIIDYYGDTIDVSIKANSNTVSMFIKSVDDE